MNTETIPQTYIEINPKVMLGKPVIKDTRITVELILEKLSVGESFDEILAEHPRLQREHILAALAFDSIIGNLDQLQGSFVVIQPGVNRVRQL